MNLFRSKPNAPEVEQEKTALTKDANVKDVESKEAQNRNNVETRSLNSVVSNTKTPTLLSKPEKPGNRDDVSNIEYSADIRPLTFNVNKSMVDKGSESSSDIHFKRSLSKVKEKLSQSNGSYDKRESMIRSLFGSIDKEQFGNYLREPRYIKMLKRGRNLKQFRRLFLAQELVVHDNVLRENKDKNASLNPETTPNAIWVTKFSIDGNFLASGGKDGVLRLWKVIASPLERWHLDFTEENIQSFKNKASILKQQTSLGSPVRGSPNPSKENSKNSNGSKGSISNLYAPVFHPTPSNIFRHHTGDILDVTWSKNNFIATASMDKTACLWHPERSSPLKSFLHADFVTCVAFHPTDDRFLITGCLDHKCRLWSILDDEVIFEFDCQDLITSLTVSSGDAAYTFVGTFNGYVYVLETKGLEFIKSFHVTDKETQDDTSKTKFTNSLSKIHHGPRVICLQSYEDIVDKSLKLAVTSNDSRIRVFDVKMKKCLEILKGFQSGSSQTNSQLCMIQNKPIIACGSEDHWVYLWRIRAEGQVEHDQEKEGDHSNKKTSIRGLFSPHKDSDESSNTKQDHSHHRLGHNPLHLRNLFPHAGCAGDQVIKNNYSVSFHAHHAPVTTVNMAPPVTTKLLSMSNDLICELSLQFYMGSDNLDIVGVGDNGKSLDVESDSSSLSSSSSISSIISPSSMKDPLKLDEKTAHERALPSVVDAIGTIMVTTDSMGVIRVFRADLPTNIRKRVLKKLEEYRSTENGKKKHTSSDSLYSMWQCSHTNPNGIHRPSNLYAKSSLGFLDDAASGGASSGKRVRASSVFKNSLFNHSSGSLNSARTNRGSASSVTLDDGGLRKASLGSNTNTIGNSMARLRCDVCNGTKFGITSPNGQASRNVGTYCLDCGTTLNNFR